MFKKLLKYFSKKDSAKENGKPLAEIRIYINENELSPTVDILLDEYSEQSIDALVNIIQSIQSQSCGLEIIKIVTDNMTKQGNSEALVYFLIKIGQEAEKYAIETQAIDRNQKKEEPCIKPSDMLK
jgi:hypothetical protein